MAQRLSPDSQRDWQELEHNIYMQIVKRVPVTLERGEGIHAWDTDGKKYLDFVAGWAVNSLGHCHPVVVDAIKQQASTLIQASNQFYTVPQLRLAELLVNNSCLDRVFFCNSGAEANEGAIKLARRYGKIKLKGANTIITTRDSFHGRTIAMVAATGQKKFQEPYKPLPGGFINVDYDDIEAIRKATGEKTCAVMLEPVQGEGGVNVPSPGYLKAVRRWCDENGMLLILDEIQTGIGRTGTLFGYQQYDVEPDIMTLAKGLGSGVPIGAVLAKKSASVFTYGEHGTTFGGNPLTCAASYAALKYIIENDLSAHAREMGEYFVKSLETLQSRYGFIKGIRGTGLLLALVFTRDIASDLVNACLKEGLLVNGVKPDALRFMPPLTVEKADIDNAIKILDHIFTGGNWNER